MAVPDESSTFPSLPPWTDDEQREYERFLDRASAMVSECSTQIDLTTDETEKADLMNWLFRIEDERKRITVHDHAAIEKAVAEYRRQLALWRAARGR